MLSSPHVFFIFLTFGLAITAAVIFGKRGFDERLLYVCCVISVLCEGIKIFFFITVRGSYDDGAQYYLSKRDLPFNLCSIQILFLFIGTLVKNKKIRESVFTFMMPTTIAGASMAILIPTMLVEFGPWTIINYQYMFYHSMLVFFGLYLYITKPIEFNIKTYIKSILMMLGYLYFAIYINAILGPGSNANMGYVTKAPMPNLPVFNMDNGWIAYIFTLIASTVVLITLVYSPVLIKKLIQYLTARKKKV
ncbi:hypothetical protein AGMMS49587_06780 [Spirochaetia bacterium]|nr:hypothetical protein AGMMS49587_06780 [Spirochaetia bacterium]